MNVNPWYLGAFIVYLILVLGIGAWGYTKTETKDDFFVYGKRLSKWLATWSFVANFISAVAAIGVIGEVFHIGYSIMLGVNFGLMLGVSGLYFVSHRVRALDKMTLADIVAEVTGREWARPITGTILLGNAWVYTIMQLVGAGVLVTDITGVPYHYMIWVIGGVFIIYTVMGGLISVAWTDLLQGTMLVALLTITAIYLAIHDGGITAVSTQFAAINPALVQPLGNNTVIGIIASIIAFFGTIFTGQNIIIRINATKDMETTKFHIAAAGVILSVFLSILTYLAAEVSIGLHHVGISVSGQDNVFPVFITHVLPTTLGTIVILGIMSAILSTTDTRLHAVGVTATQDIYDYFRPDASDERHLQVSRWATIFFGVVAILIGMNPPGSIFALYSFRAVLLTTGLLIPIYAALYWRGTDGRAIVSAMVTGAVFGVGSKIAGSVAGIPPAILGVGISILTLIILGLYWRASSPSNASATN